MYCPFKLLRSVAYFKKMYCPFKLLRFVAYSKRCIVHLSFQDLWIIQKDVLSIQAFEICGLFKKIYCPFKLFRFVDYSKKSIVHSSFRDLRLITTPTTDLPSGRQLADDTGADLPESIRSLEFPPPAFRSQSHRNSTLDGRRWW